MGKKEKRLQTKVYYNLRFLKFLENQKSKKFKNL